MRKHLFIAALAMAGATAAFADVFAGLDLEAELDRGAMSAIFGELFKIVVPYNGKGEATVTSDATGKVTSYKVPVTTVAKAANPSNKPTNKGRDYEVVPLPTGTYTLGAAKTMSDPKYGSGIHIEAAVTTPYKDSKDTFQASDFFIHQTPYGNTWGCVGVTDSSGMSKVLSTYAASSEPKSLVVTSGSSDVGSSSSAIASYGIGCGGSKPCYWY